MSMQMDEEKTIEDGGRSRNGSPSPGWTWTIAQSGTARRVTTNSLGEGGG